MNLTGCAYDKTGRLVATASGNDLVDVLRVLERDPALIQAAMEAFSLHIEHENGDPGFWLLATAQDDRIKAILQNRCILCGGRPSYTGLFTPKPHFASRIGQPEGSRISCRLCKTCYQLPDRDARVERDIPIRYRLPVGRLQ